MAPYYLSIGMTHDQYWDGDATLVVEYRKAEEIRQKRSNYEKWLQGMYIYDAICDASPLFQPFVKKGTKAHPYPDKPYPITKDEVQAREEEKARMQMQKNKDLLKGFAETFNEKFKKNGEE